ncbi:MAG: hypothetical protein WC081_02745 [Candidatus Ratteibacteria bacterium]|jgi:hypothetical protein
MINKILSGFVLGLIFMSNVAFALTMTQEEFDAKYKGTGGSVSGTTKDAKERGFEILDPIVGNYVNPDEDTVTMVAHAMGQFTPRLEFKVKNTQNSSIGLWFKVIFLDEKETRILSEDWRYIGEIPSGYTKGPIVFVCRQVWNPQGFALSEKDYDAIRKRLKIKLLWSFTGSNKDWKEIQGFTERCKGIFAPR